MIQKEFRSSPKMHILKKLYARLHSEEIKVRIQQDIAKIEAGDFGEEIVAKRLNTYKNAIDIHIFHDVMLYQNGLFQIDFLIVTSSCIIILEVKNISGHIYFTQNPQQLIRKIKGQPDQKFRSPETQIQKYIKQLEIWNYSHQYNIPIYGAVVFPTLSSIVNSDNTMTHILDLDEIEQFIYKQNQENTENTDVQKFINRIKEKAIDYRINTLGEYYNFKLYHLNSDFLCPKCHSKMLKKSRRKWNCSNCTYTGQRIIKEELDEYLSYFHQDMLKQDLQKFMKDVSKSTFYREWKKTQK